MNAQTDGLEKPVVTVSLLIPIVIILYRCESLISKIGLDRACIVGKLKPTTAVLE